MNSRSIQIMTVGIFLVALVIAALLVRKSMNQEKAVEGEVSTLSKRPVPAERSPQDLGVRPERDDEGYGAGSDGLSNLFPDMEMPEMVNDDNVLDEEECQRLTTHLQRLGGTSDPAEAQIANQFCKLEGISATFARCALKQTSQQGLQRCGGLSKRALKNAQKVGEEAMKQLEEEGIDMFENEVLDREERALEAREDAEDKRD